MFTFYFEDREIKSSSSSTAAAAATILQRTRPSSSVGTWLGGLLIGKLARTDQKSNPGSSKHIQNRPHARETAALHLEHKRVHLLLALIQLVPAVARRSRRPAPRLLRRKISHGDVCEDTA